jgi:hypothetical protein
MKGIDIINKINDSLISDNWDLRFENCKLKDECYNLELTIKYLEEYIDFLELKEEKENQR